MALPVLDAKDWLKSASTALPESYSVDRLGTYQTLSAKRGSPDGLVKKIASCPVIVCALARDEVGEAWSIQLEYLGPDGEVSRLLVPATELNARQSTFVDRLAYLGVLVEPGALLNFRSYLFAASAAPALPRLMLASRLGFQRDPNNRKWVFVLPGKTLGVQGPTADVVAREQLIFEPSVHVVTLEGYRSAGTLDEWKNAMAPFADHPVIVAGVLFGLAGPFAIPAGVENGGLHIFGETSTGKSAALQACASVAGCASDTARGGDRDSLFQRWHSTLNAIDGMLQPHSGMAVTIDEVGANDGQLNLYNVFGGRGKARLDETGGMRAQANWSAQVLSSGEYPMRDHVESVGKRRVTGGQTTRMLDVPTHEVIERALAAGAPALPPPDVLGPLIDQLKGDCGRVYGTALPALVSKVMAAYAGEGDDFATDLSQAVVRRCEVHSSEASQNGFELRGPQRRALIRLALMEVVGEWAVDAEVVPFTADQVSRAVSAVRDAWLSTGAYVSEEEQVLRRIRGYAMRYLDDVRNSDPRTSTPPGGWHYFALRRSGLLAFTEEQLERASGASNIVAVGKILARAGWLHRNDARRQRCDVPAELRGLVGEGRIFLLSARPVLGDLLETLARDGAGLLAVSDALPDEDGVLQDRLEGEGDHVQ